jgi:SAM-dependent methyltransferase
MMANTFEEDKRKGWERIWRSGDIPPRYGSSAPPNDSVVELADRLPPDAFVLDIGCGVGRHLLYLGGRGFRMAGVDISPSGVQASQQVCAEQGILVDARVSDMNALPWEDNTFDGAFAISTIHHHRRAGIVESLREARRVLKPGGLLLVDFPSTDTLQYQRARRQVNEGVLVEVEPNTFVSERTDLPEHDDEFLPHHFCDEADLRDLLCDFDSVNLWADLRDTVSEEGIAGKAGKWVAWARKPAAT